MKHPRKKILDPRKKPRKKVLDPRITHEEKLGPTKYPQKNTLDPRNTHEKKLWTHEGTMARWHKAHEIHDGTRPTEFSTSIQVLCNYVLDLTYSAPCLYFGRS